MRPITDWRTSTAVSWLQTGAASALLTPATSAALMRANQVAAISLHLIPLDDPCAPGRPDAIYGRGMLANVNFVRPPSIGSFNSTAVNGTVYPCTSSVDSRRAHPVSQPVSTPRLQRVWSPRCLTTMASQLQFSSEGPAVGSQCHDHRQRWAVSTARWTPRKQF